MKYYVTKYALGSKGTIETIDCEKAKYIDGYVRQTGGYWGSSFKVGRDAHETVDMAMRAADAARLKKIASLKKQIAALEKMVFTVKEPQP